MTVNQLESGQSVYIPVDYEATAKEPLYLAVRELVRRYSKSKTILELGGGALVSTGNLFPEFSIFNLELDASLLDFVRRKFPEMIQVRADLNDELPFGSLGEIDVVVALDIFDHLEKDSVITILRRLNDLKKEEPFVVIV